MIRHGRLFEVTFTIVSSQHWRRSSSSRCQAQWRSILPDVECELLVIVDDNTLGLIQPVNLIDRPSFVASGGRTYQLDRQSADTALIEMDRFLEN